MWDAWGLQSPNDLKIRELGKEERGFLLTGLFSHFT